MALPMKNPMCALDCTISVLNISRKLFSVHFSCTKHIYEKYRLRISNIPTHKATIYYPSISNLD